MVHGSVPLDLPRRNFASAVAPSASICTKRTYVVPFSTRIFCVDRLLMDIAGHCLLEAQTLAPVVCSLQAAKPSGPIGIDTVEQCGTPFTALLKKFPQLTAPDFAAHTPHQHFIPTEGPPVWCRPRRLSPDKLQAAKAEFDNLLRSGIVRPSKSAWASPLHMARKSNGEWRPCGDYCRLNAVSTPDRYPVPNVQDLAAQLHSIQFNSTDILLNYRDKRNSCVGKAKKPRGAYEL